MMMVALTIAFASDSAVPRGQARAILVWKASLDNQNQDALAPGETCQQLAAGAASVAVPVCMGASTGWRSLASL